MLKFFHLKSRITNGEVACCPYSDSSIGLIGAVASIKAPRLFDVLTDQHVTDHRDGIPM